MSSTLSESTGYLAELDSEYGPVTVQRGLAYAAEGRVSLLSVERDALEIHVEASVQGSVQPPYQVDLWLSLTPTGAIRGVDNDCTCPVGMDCKHAVAALWVYYQQAGLVPTEEGGLSAEAFPEPSTAALEWLDELEDTPPVIDLPAPSKKALPQRVVYLLRRGQAMRLVCHAWKGRG